jgi:carboxymethylenebutenolidase
VFTLGFCFGGRLSWTLAALRIGLAGATGFYGRSGDFQDATPRPARRAREMEAPILALQAGADASITSAENQAFESALGGRRRARARHVRRRAT